MQTARREPVQEPEKETITKTIKEVLQYRKLVCDGAFGTYYAMKYDTRELPELANLSHPDRVREIHEEYIRAGAGMIRTNTYACNTVMLQTDPKGVSEYLRQGYALAMEAVRLFDRETAKSMEGETAQGQTEQDQASQSVDRRGKESMRVYIAADIGPIPCENISERDNLQQEYVEICRTFLEMGAECILFETFPDLEDILPAVSFVGDRAFVIVQFSVNQFGYSNAGLSARRLLEEAEACRGIDAVGFNCGVGPGHMQQILKNLIPSGEKILSALPNSGYPQTVSSRMIFSRQNVEYFASKAGEIAEEGADIIGGCCGTTPEHIRRICETIDFTVNKKNRKTENIPVRTAACEDFAFYRGREDRKLIAVELAPPVGSDDERLMDAAHLLKQSGVDVLTFPDSPSGRTRADSILMAEKVSRETGMCVMPHICCRDKNIIAMRSQLLGAFMNRIHNFLVITGDPVPSMVRASVKSVFEFDAVGLMKMMNDMNRDQFKEAPLCYGGAINQGRRNLEVEIGRVKKKMAAGASFFLTQPVSTAAGAERVRRIKQETGARVLCGIMPFVSLKNALFMKNEMTGIDVTDEVLARYRADMTRGEGEQAGIRLAKEVIAMTEDFADGYYFSFPFNRVHLLKDILGQKNPADIF